MDKIEILIENVKLLNECVKELEEYMVYTHIALCSHLQDKPLSAAQVEAICADLNREAGDWINGLMESATKGHDNYKILAIEGI